MIGIYLIRNVLTDKVYIGSSKNYDVRIREHISKLRRNVHSNKRLQNSWNKYGKKFFKFDFLEETTYENLKSLITFGDKYCNINVSSLKLLTKFLFQH
jgi:group I intron endonuclease